MNIYQTIRSIFGIHVHINPQNMEKDSRPSYLLNKYGLVSSDILWIMDKGKYLGFAISSRAQQIPEIGHWITIRGMQRMSKITPSGSYIIYDERNVVGQKYNYYRGEGHY